MAIRTQIRLQQLTGSIKDVAYSGSLSSVGQDSALDHSNLAEVLGQMAGTIGRITGKNSTGANSFTNAAAGNFYQALTVNAAGGITIGAGGDELVISENSDDALITNAKSDKDIIFRVNDGGSANTEGFRIDGSESSLLMAASKKIQLGAAEEAIYGDGTDIHFEVGANGDINIPADIGLTFGDDGEKIEGNGTDLTIAGNNIVLEVTGDVKLDTNTGLVLSSDAAEKIESDGTDITFTVGAGGDINIGSEIGLTFGNDGEKIEGDGTDLTIASSNHLEIQTGGDINLDADGGDISLMDGGALFLKFTNSSQDIEIRNGAADKDIKFLDTGGNEVFRMDGGEEALLMASSKKLMLGATQEYLYGDGTDIHIGVGANGDINIPADIGLTFGDDGEKIEGNGTDLTIAGNNIVLEVTGDVKLDTNTGLVLSSDAAEKIESDGTDITFTVGAGGDINIGSSIGITFGDDGEKIEGDGTNLVIASSGELSLNVTDFVGIQSPYLEIGNGSTNAGRIRINEDGDNGSNYIDFGAPAVLGGNYTFTLPNGNGTDGYALTTNGSGVTSWTAISAADTIAKTVMYVDTDQRLVAGTALNPNSATISNTSPSTRAGLDLSGVTAAKLDRLVDVFVNGQLLTSGSEANRAAGTADYNFSTHSATSQIKFAFDLEMDDVVVVQKKG